MQHDRKPRRSYGTGSLMEREDAAGRVTYYGQWRSGGRLVKRAIGPKRAEGTRDGLTRAQAEAALRRAIAETPAAPRVAGERLAIDELGRRYLAHLERQGRKKSTRTAVDSVLVHWLEPFFRDRAVGSITADDVHDLISMMEEGRRLRPVRPADDGSPRPEPHRVKPVGPKSVRNYVGTLSAMMAFAVKRRWAPANPVADVELPAVEGTEEIRFLELDEVEAVVAAAVEGEYRAIDAALYLAAATTGLRQGELLALRWRDVCPPTGRVRVRQNFVLGEFGTPKSRRSSRSVPLREETAVRLADLRAVAARAGDEDLVFGDPHSGEPLARAALMRRYRRALAAAGVDPAHRFHDLRHTFGTRCAAAGVPMRTLQEWMGHVDIQTTQRYADYAPSPHEQALVEAAFRPVGAPPALAAVS
jgi:integrase